MPLTIKFLTALTLFGFFSQAQAKELCVQNANEFNQMKNQIPPLFHSLPEKPVFFTIDRFEVTGGLKVRTHEKGHFVFEGYFRKLLKYQSDVNDVEKICFIDKEVNKVTRTTVVVHFGQGKEAHSAIVENSGISIDDYLISANSSDKSFEKIKRKIETVVVGQKEDQQAGGAF